MGFGGRKLWEGERRGLGWEWVGEGGWDWVWGRGRPVGEGEVRREGFWGGKEFGVRGRGFGVWGGAVESVGYDTMLLHTTSKDTPYCGRYIGTQRKLLSSQPW